MSILCVNVVVTRNLPLEKCFRKQSQKNLSKNFKHKSNDETFLMSRKKICFFDLKKRFIFCELKFFFMYVQICEKKIGLNKSVSTKQLVQF